MNNRWTITTSQWLAPANDPAQAIKALKDDLTRCLKRQPDANLSPSAWRAWSLEMGAIVAEILRVDEDFNPPCEWLTDDDTQTDNG